MELQPWDPWREFERVRAEADAIVTRFLAKVRQLVPPRPIAFVPTADVIETGVDLRLFLSLPGVVEEDIDIGVEGDVLVVRGELECPYDPERAGLHREEWRYGYFERRFVLPPEVDREALSATFRAGVLTVVIPKREAPPSGADG